MADGYVEFAGVADLVGNDLQDVPHNSDWDTGDTAEFKVHRIHAYPAKFPAFITHKALAYARHEQIHVQKVADIFCGCGTVAFEAQRESLAFWGCDINPVATLIARAKSNCYDQKRLQHFFDEILVAYKTASRAVGVSASAKARLEYWFPDAQIRNLARLKNSIYAVVPERSRYRDFFLCAFSNILKSTSRWLTKSIKPQIDPDKKPAQVISAFTGQVNFMMKAFLDAPKSANTLTTIQTANFLTVKEEGLDQVDMIVTSPPYVTSYEYADLHQLSSLWLGFADDYRDLRNGSIGTSQHDFNFNREVKRLNRSGTDIVFKLLTEDATAAKSVARYFLDMQQVASRCAKVLRENGLGVFVIGNTSYKGVHVNNAAHLAESLLDAGFANVSLARRRITNKILTPYRTANGRFTRPSTEVKSEVYSEEFIVIAKR